MNQNESGALRIAVVQQNGNPGRTADEGRSSIHVCQAVSRDARP